jgi:hypothetical protein
VLVELLVEDPTEQQSPREWVPQFENQVEVGEDHWQAKWQELSSLVGQNLLD